MSKRTKPPQDRPPEKSGFFGKNARKLALGGALLSTTAAGFMAGRNSPRSPEPPPLITSPLSQNITDTDPAKDQLVRSAASFVDNASSLLQTADGWLNEQRSKMPQGATSLGTSDLISRLLKENDHIVFGDTDHSAEEIGLFIASQMKNLKQSGVDAIFLELDQSKNGFLTYDPTSFQLIPTIYFLETLAMEYGIKTYKMDTPLSSEAAKRGCELYFQHRKLRKTLGEGDEKTRAAFEALKGPDYDAFLKERDEVNAKWVKFIAKTTKDNNIQKSVSMCGNAHVDGAKNFDELLAHNGSAGNVVRVDIETSPFKSGHTTSNEVYDPSGKPHYTVIIPELPEDMKKGMTLEDFLAVVATEKWDGIGARAISEKNPEGEILHMGLENYERMMERNDWVHRYVYRELKPAAVRIAQKEGIFSYELLEQKDKINLMNELIPSIEKAQKEIAQSLEPIQAFHAFSGAWEKEWNEKLKKRRESDAGKRFLKTRDRMIEQLEDAMVNVARNNPDEALRLVDAVHKTCRRKDVMSYLSTQCVDSARQIIHYNKFMRQGNEAAADLTKGIDSYNEWEFGYPNWSDNMDPACRRLFIADKHRQQLFEQACDALFDDDPVTAQCCLQQLQRGREAFIQLKKDTMDRLSKMDGGKMPVEGEGGSMTIYPVHITEDPPTNSFDVALRRYIDEKEKTRGHSR
jgi:hypothetical protein